MRPFNRLIDDVFQYRSLAERMIQTGCFTDGQTQHQKNRPDNKEKNEETGQKGTGSFPTTRPLFKQKVRLLEKSGQNSCRHDSRQKWLEDEKHHHPDSKEDEKKEIGIEEFDLHSYSIPLSEFFVENIE